MVNKLLDWFRDSPTDSDLQILFDSSKWYQFGLNQIKA